MGQNADKYKDTIQLPQTDFPMRGNLPQREPEFLKMWDENQIYHKMAKRNADKKRYTMPDGPPYANGNLHVGHVLNKVLKDIVIKYKNMSGNSAAFVPGWDCHGLPIELTVTKSLGEKRKEMSDAQIRDLCRKEALKWVGIQKEQFHRLGVLAEWENPYLTLNPGYEAAEVRVFAKALENDVVYQGKKPVYWCYALQTALADAEVEYKDHKSPSIYVKFEVADDGGKFEGLDKPVYFVIWTTTPWTLPANVAIALNPELDYGLFDSGDSYLVIAEGLKEAVEKECEVELKEVQKHKGSAFEGMTAQHPFIQDRKSKIILGDHVTLDAGTGCVHTAPGHGTDDYIVGLKYDLPILSPVDEEGKYTKEVPEYEGTHIFKANPLIIEKLVNSGHMLHHSEFTHSYPHCWRSGVPLFFRTTPQWFIGIDQPKYNIRKMAKEAMNEISFYPEWGRKRFEAMIDNRPDWCVSRQRIWGVPIPVLYCKETGEPLLDSTVMNKIADKMENGAGLEEYWSTPIEEFTSHLKFDGEFGSKGFKRGTDILDVWFDSGVCHTAVQDAREQLDNPADIYLEGSDQHRGWFNTSLISSIAANGKAPFKALVTHGFVNDEKGQKMSKSKGNVIDPATIIKQNGAEILRLWTAYEDYGSDLKCGKENFARVTETYRRLRNTMRFLLGNMADFDYQKDKVEVEAMPKLDQWALHSLNQLVESCTKHYEEYNFYKVYHALNLFFTVDMSAFYLDILKDRLYTWKKDGVERRASQTVIYEILWSTSRLMAPILSFLAEEVYGFFPGKTEESVFLTDFPTTNPKWNNPQLAEEMKVVQDVRSLASKQMEEMRAKKEIKSSLEAEIEITASSTDMKNLKVMESELKEIFIVSNLSLKEGSGDTVATAKVASGEKCPRCWHISSEITADKPVCPKCEKALA
jgi:isoleucyl-tRNA synthetase